VGLYQILRWLTSRTALMASRRHRCKNTAKSSLSKMTLRERKVLMCDILAKALKTMPRHNVNDLLSNFRASFFDSPYRTAPKLLHSIYNGLDADGKSRVKGCRSGAMSPPFPAWQGLAACTASGLPAQVFTHPKATSLKVTIALPLLSFFPSMSLMHT